MEPEKTEPESTPKTINRGDPFLDRRSGEEQRAVHSLDYFEQGNLCRRRGVERRTNIERRVDYVRISEWASVCRVPDENEHNDEYMNLKI